MRALLKKTANVIYKQFKLFWILCTFVALILVLSLNWYLSVDRSYKQLQIIASSVSNNVDRFIEDLFQDAYTLPVYGTNISDCKSGLLPYMEHITLNNTKISGLVISDNSNKLICSTLPNNDIIISESKKARSISGPVEKAVFDQPVYFVQQKMGHYHIGIIIVSSILENVINTSKPEASSIAIYNQYDKKNIIRVEKNSTKKDWILSKNIEAQSPINSKILFASDQLQSIDGMAVIVFENHKTLLYNLWFSQIAITFILCVVSYFLYYLLKNMITKRYSLHNAMKLALKNNEFYPVYQPLFDVQNNCYTGAEVLLRWQDNQDEIIMPDFFITEAETTGLIVPITLQIIDIAFREFYLILKENPGFHLAFNLSALHFTDASFFNEFNRLAEKYEIAPKQVIFEVTERDLLDKNNKVFNGTMQELRKAGYSLAVDDYGTGHASISYLQHFPFNYLKIDKVFIQAIGTKAITESLNDAIIHMAKQLNLSIIAEGVETEEQVKYLSNNGVRYLQGWYFSKALSVDKLTGLLKGDDNDSNQ